MRVIKREFGKVPLYPHKMHNTTSRPLCFALTNHFPGIVIHNQSNLQHTYQNLPNGAKFEGNQIIVVMNQSKDMANLKFQMLDQARKFNMYDYLYEHFI